MISQKKKSLLPKKTLLYITKENVDNTIENFNITKENVIISNSCPQNAVDLQFNKYTILSNKSTRIII